MGTYGTEQSPTSLLLDGDGLIPNNPRLAVLHYHAVFDPDGAGDDLASQFESLFEAHQWPPAWRSGIFEFHHFHSTAHEALGVFAGEVTVRLGGESGTDVQLRAGDVAVLPAGVGHKQMSCSPDLGIVGAYPAGSVVDACRADAQRYAQRERAVSAVSMPAADPVSGVGGPLLRLWGES